MTSTTTTVYKHVVEDVIKNMKHEFLSEGIPESVLLELQQLWETKLKQSDTAAQPAVEGGEAGNAYGNAQNIYLDPASLPDNPLLLAPYNDQSFGRYQPPQPQEPSVEPQYGRPQPFMAPMGDWNGPQLIPLPSGYAPGRPAPAAGPAHRGRPAPHANVPQYDGGDDDDDDDDDDNGIKKETHGDDEDLGSDLDDEEGEEPDTDNIVLCQFEKVTRIKNKRKCNLKAGVMHLNGRDYLFNRANGEFEW